MAMNMQDFKLTIVVVILMLTGGCTINYEVDLGDRSAESAQRDLAAIIEAHYAWQLQQFPMLATQAGVTRYNDRLGSVSPPARKQRLDDMLGFVEQLSAIDAQQLSQSDQINEELLI